METVLAMNNEGLDILRKLEDNCLLESNKDKCRKDCVRMHDLVRDMALQITRTSPRFMVEVGKALTKLPERGKWTEDLEKVSLMWNKIEEIPSSILTSKCTMLTTLLLSHNNLSTISESIFEHLLGLKILDLSYNEQLRSLPSSISNLVNLTTLLLKMTSLTEVPSLSKLGALKKLDLGRTRIKKVPKSLEMCTNLRYLSLRGYWGIFDDTTLFFFFGFPSGIRGFAPTNPDPTRVAHLEMVDERIVLRGEVIGALKTLEVIGILKKLEVFEGWFPTVHDWSIFLNCVHGQGDGLSRYHLRVGKKTRGFLFENYLKSIAFSGIDIVGETITLPPSVHGLLIECCDNLRSLNDFSSIKDATDLRRCEVVHCEGMECVFTSWINPLVQTVEELILSGLNKLEGLLEAEVIAMSPPPPPGTFSSLKSIELYSCGKIKRLIPSEKLLGYLQSLELIEINKCEELEEIIALDPEEEAGDIIKKLNLPKLKYLRLRSLLALKSICSGRAVMVCDSLEYIEIWGCEGLRRIPVYLPLSNKAQPSRPPSLKEISAIPREWWELLEWDHPNAKDVLQSVLRPMHEFEDYTLLESEQSEWEDYSLCDSEQLEWEDYPED
ncbi:hypothetical protein SLEP1_g41159 [Rubroshorea leprosula]|nr:hypothetical protein SLEP1_g41159 [Rubroshorea leprosula]